MLTGLFSPDSSSNGYISLYDTVINSHTMYRARQSLGVCPQHDVLFDQLSVLEHLLFFAQLKGRSYVEAEAEALHLTSLFHLEKRRENKGEELSGGQRRKLSVLIALCGGSKLVVLDEPTAGMDPLARRELWDLLSSLRRGRTVLLTTHYMDEAEVLGDRVGVMSQGEMVCLGSPQFLKRKFGVGYRLVVEYDSSSNAQRDSDKDRERQREEQRERTVQLIQNHVSFVSLSVAESVDDTAVFLLSYDDVRCFADLFSSLDTSMSSLRVKCYGLSGSTLEDVFLRAESLSSNNNKSISTVVNNSNSALKRERLDLGGMNQRFVPLFHLQVLAIFYRRLSYSLRDYSTSVPLLLLPMLAAVGGAAVYSLQLISRDFAVLNAIIANALYVVGYLGMPGLLAEFIVKERNDKLRNLLTVSGCDYRAYWLGTFLADFVLLLPTSVVLWVTWIVTNMTAYYQAQHGLNFFVCLLFNAQNISFAYLSSYLFESPKSCVSFLPTLIVALDIAPSFVYSLFNQLLTVFQKSAGAPSRVVVSAAS